MRIIFLVLINFLTLSLFSQNAAFTNEITYSNDKVYFNGSLFSGWLYSVEDGIPNDCDCILKAKYLRGVLNGNKQEWYNNGKLKTKTTYTNGEISGLYQKYYKNGKLKEKSTYTNNTIQNKTLFYANGVKRKEEKYKNGKIYFSKLYNKDGTEKGASVTTNNPIKKPVTNSEINVIATNQTQTESVYNNGLIYTYFPFGEKKRIKLYNNGLLVKDSIFNQKGILKSTKKYSSGELVHQETFNDKGQMTTEENYLNNKKDGLQLAFYNEGNPKLIESFKNGMLTHAEHYNTDKILVLEENYYFDKKNGNQKVFNNTGKLTNLKVYNMGLLEKEIKYTNKGKEVIHILDKLESIKVYNLDDKLVLSKYNNINTNKKDSLWVTYNPKNGFKIKEDAYVNGFLIRKGNYINNKKNGSWYYYAKDKKSQIQKNYENDSILSTKKIIYAKQIKTNIKENDILFKYVNISENNKPSIQYVLLHFDKSLDGNYNRIKKGIYTAFNQNLEVINDVSIVENEELHSIYNLNSIGHKVKLKKPKSKKQIVYIESRFSFNNIQDNAVIDKYLLASPVNEENTNITKLYTDDIEKAFLSTLSNYSVKLNNYIKNSYPLKGQITKILEQSSNKIKKTVINLGKNNGVLEEDIFVLLDKNNKVKVRLKVSEISLKNARCKVEFGDEWLFNYLKINHNPIVIKK